MAVDVDMLVRTNFAKVISTGTAPEDIDPDADMEEYGLTSLEKILLLTATCDGAGVDLGVFTEQDVEAMRTVRDVTKAMQAHTEGAC